MAAFMACKDAAIDFNPAATRPNRPDRISARPRSRDERKVQLAFNFRLQHSPLDHSRLYCLPSSRWLYDRDVEVCYYLKTEKKQGRERKTENNRGRKEIQVQRRMCVHRNAPLKFYDPSDDKHSNAPVLLPREMRAEAEVKEEGGVFCKEKRNCSREWSSLALEGSRTAGVRARR